MSTAAPSPAPGRPVVRERILAAAHRHFEELGYRRASVVRIARDAGIAPATLYAYFDGKESLFGQVVDRATEQWLAMADEVVAQPRPALERLLLLGQASGRFDRESHLHRGIMSRDDEMIFAPLLDELHARNTRITVERIAQLVREAIEEGSIRAVDPDKTAVLLFTCGMALMDHQDLLPYDEVLPVFEDLLMKGLLPR